MFAIFAEDFAPSRPSKRKPLNQYMNMKKILLSLMLLAGLSFSATAQWDFSTSADFQSRYVWRGQPLGGEGPSVQPGAQLSYGGISLSVWGAYNLAMTQYQELDFTLAYTLFDELLTLQVTDYSFPTLMSGYRYFDYAANHVLEGGLLVKVPHTNLSLALFTNFYGADATDAAGDMVYSTYCEASYTLPWESKHTEFDFAIGAALNGEAGYSFYGNDGFGIVNISVGATKTLEVTPTLKLPVYGRLIANPVADKMFLVCGTTIEL